MSISINTPALLFPAITLLLLAYTNRFLAVATLIRQLHKKQQDNPTQSVLVSQIRNLRTRIRLIKNMQIFGVISFVFCVISMSFIFNDNSQMAEYGFAVSLGSLMLSLLLSLWELQISTRALELELGDME